MKRLIRQRKVLIQLINLKLGFGIWMKREKT